MPFPGQNSSGDEVFGEHGSCDLSPPPFLHLGFWFSGCTTGAPSQVDVDSPEPQEVLVSKEPAYNFVANVSLGLRLPSSGSGCLSLERDGLQWASSVQSFVL